MTVSPVGSPTPSAGALPGPSDRARPNILITGTPGTGKTTTASLIAEETGFAHVDVSALVKKEVRCRRKCNGRRREEWWGRNAWLGEGGGGWCPLQPRKEVADTIFNPWVCAKEAPGAKTLPCRRDQKKRQTPTRPGGLSAPLAQTACAHFISSPHPAQSLHCGRDDAMDSLIIDEDKVRQCVKHWRRFAPPVKEAGGREYCAPPPPPHTHTPALALTTRSASHLQSHPQVVDALEDQLSAGGVVLDYHSCDFFPERWFDLVLVLTTANDVLYDRLAARGYAPAKITSNVECEIMRVCADEAGDAYDAEIVKVLPSNSVEEMEANVAWVGEWVKKMAPAGPVCRARGGAQ